MTNTELFIEQLPVEQKLTLAEFFGSIAFFYATIYLMAKNGHLIQEAKGENWEQGVKTVQYYQERAEILLNALGIQGSELVQDIASDYFEDFVNYKEREFQLSQEQFVANISKLQDVK